MSWIPEADDEPEEQPIEVEPVAVEVEPRERGELVTPATPVEEQEPELDVRPEFLQAKSLLDQFEDHS